MSRMKQEDDTLVHPVGTRFLKRIQAWGECEGVITSYDDKREKYTVQYPSIKMEQDLDGTQLSSDGGATIITNWDTHLLQEGQHVWAFQGKGKHPAIIQSINRSDEMAFVKWTNSNTTGEVALNNLFPMFDTDSSGERRTSRYSRRTRKHTDHYVFGGDRPLANAASKPSNLRMRAFKEESPEDVATATKEEKHISLRQGTRKRMRTNFYIHGGDEAVLANAMSKRSNLRQQLLCKEECEDTKGGASVLFAEKSEVKQLGPPKQKKNPVKEQTEEYPTSFLSLKQPSEDEVPGPGWRFEKGYWVSPVEQLEFTMIQACKFEAYRVELDGNEVEAYHKYQKYFGASAKSQIRETNENVKHEDDELDPQIEYECNKLWDYYMNEKERRGEEIPGGMCLRKKV